MSARPTPHHGESSRRPWLPRGAKFADDFFDDDTVELVLNAAQMRALADAAQEALAERLTHPSAAAPTLESESLVAAAPQLAFDATPTVDVKTEAKPALDSTMVLEPLSAPEVERATRIEPLEAAPSQASPQPAPLSTAWTQPLPSRTAPGLPTRSESARAPARAVCTPSPGREVASAAPPIAPPLTVLSTACASTFPSTAVTRSIDAPAPKSPAKSLGCSEAPAPANTISNSQSATVARPTATIRSTASPEATATARPARPSSGSSGAAPSHHPAQVHARHPTHWPLTRIAVLSGITLALLVALSSIALRPTPEPKPAPAGIVANAPAPKPAASTAQAPPVAHPTSNTAPAGSTAAAPPIKPAPDNGASAVGAPVRFRNPFDASETFEFPPGTSLQEARDRVAALLLERGRERHIRLRPERRRANTRVNVGPDLAQNRPRRSR